MTSALIVKSIQDAAQVATRRIPLARIEEQLADMMLLDHPDDANLVLYAEVLELRRRLSRHESLVGVRLPFPAPQEVDK